MTNFGSISGLWLGGFVANMIEPSIDHLANKLIQHTLGALIIVGLTGLFQGLVLRQLGFSGIWWTVATSLGWAVGILFSGDLIFRRKSSVRTKGVFPWVGPSAAIAGAVVGAPQLLDLWRRLSPVDWWWIAASALGWGMQFPGMVPGLALTRLFRE